MKLNIIDFKDVQADVDSGATTNFNTNFHTKEEAPDLDIPTNLPYSFERWLPLILQSRGIPATAVQIVSLNRAQARIISDAATASIHTRVLNRAYAEDLREEVHPAFAQLVFPPEGLFMRLRACSPKDGIQTIPGQMSLHSVDDIVLRITTSGRAMSSFNNMLNGDDQEIRIIFLPFDIRMKTEREYRVFCVPGSLRITAVSQYKWNRPWMFAITDFKRMEETAEQIMKGIKEVHTQIVDNLQDNGSNHIDGLVRTQGFVFDVLYDEGTGHCILIELNTFGVRSACGSCLFQWVKDRDLLYGKNSESVEFRVAM